MTDMQQIFVQRPHFSLAATQDITGLTKRLELEGDLNIEEFLALKRVLTVTQELTDFYDELENVDLQRLNRLLKNCWLFLTCKDCCKPSMRVDLSKALRVTI